RGWTALRRVHRRAALHDRAEPVFRDRAGLLVLLDRAVDGAGRRVCPRRYSRPGRAVAAMSVDMPAAMSGPALETRGLCKSFGALTVADQIDFRLERGARQAFIGPNGAGKTTFVELVTGGLSPSTGRILIDDVDVTELPQAARVKRGLARTFQINALFRRLTTLENVTLAIAERDGVADDLLRPAGRQNRVIEEAFALLD